MRQETPDNVLYAIRNGGFSGAIMPENIVVGKDAEDVAAFLVASTRARSQARRARVLDLRLIRRDPDAVRAALARRVARARRARRRR